MTICLFIRVVWLDNLAAYVFEVMIPLRSHSIPSRFVHLRLYACTFLPYLDVTSVTIPRSINTILKSSNAAVYIELSLLVLYYYMAIFRQQSDSTWHIQWTIVTCDKFHMSLYRSLQAEVP